MLKITSKKELEILSVDMSGYTPFIAEFQNQKSQVPIYWRIGNFDNTLLEIAINSHSGCISSVSILMLSEPIYMPLTEKNELSVEVCMPIIEVEKWPEDGDLDIHSDFKVCGYDNSLRLILSNDIKPVKIYRNQSVDFFVGSAGELIGIEFSNLDKAELSDLLMIGD